MSTDLRLQNWLTWLRRLSGSILLAASLVLLGNFLHASAIGMLRLSSSWDVGMTYWPMSALVTMVLSYVLIHTAFKLLGPALSSLWMRRLRLLVAGVLLTGAATLFGVYLWVILMSLLPIATWEPGPAALTLNTVVVGFIEFVLLLVAFRVLRPVCTRTS